MTTERTMDWNDWTTKRCQLWLDNDEFFYQLLTELIADGDPSDAHRVSKIAAFIRDYVEDGKPALEPSLYDDLINALLSEIDYYALANDYIDTYDE